MMAGNHTRTWVIKASDEQYDLTCIVEKIFRKLGWMFWGSFNGTTKSLTVFWEKNWGIINKEIYCERVVFLIHGWFRINPHLFLMQNGAPGHAAKTTIEKFTKRNVRIIWWPVYNPDFNPIETVWDKMKDWI